MQRLCSCINISWP